MVLKVLFPTDPNLASDFLWLQTSYYFGVYALKEKKFKYLENYLDIITDLSPQWERPYRFAAIIFPTEIGNINDGLEFIDKGLVYNPKNWKLWFYKGYYLMNFYHNYSAASEALYKASNLPNSPKYLGRLSATLATKAGQKELGIRYLQMLLRRTEDPSQKKILKDKLMELINETNSPGLE